MLHLLFWLEVICKFKQNNLYVSWYEYRDLSRFNTKQIFDLRNFNQAILKIRREHSWNGKEELSQGK